MASPASEPRAATRALCLAAIRDLGEATVTDVASRTGLSRPTSEVALTRLAAGGLVEHRVEQGRSGEGGGRPAQLSRFRPEQGHVVGIDLSGALVRVSIADLAGRVVETVSGTIAGPTSDRPGIEPIAEALDEVLGAAGLTRQDVRAAGVGVAGLAQPDGTMLTSTVRGWVGTNVRDRIAAGLDLPVSLDNDLSLAATAEARLGALADVRTGVYVLTWHHVSARITIDGEVLRGRHHSAGEVGLLKAFSGIEVPSGPLTEALPPIAADLRLLRTDPSDRRGRAALEAIVTAMTPALASLVLAVDPDRVVLGGSLAAFADLIAPGLTASVNGFVEGADQLDVVIGGARFGDSGVSIGAIHQAFAAFSEEIYGTPGVPPPDLTLTTDLPSPQTHPTSNEPAVTRGTFAS